MSGAEAGPAVNGIIYVIGAIVGVAIALGAAIIPGQRQLQKQVTDMARSLGRLEGQMKVLSNATLPAETEGDEQDDR